MKYFFILGRTSDLSIVEIQEIILQKLCKSEFSLKRPKDRVLLLDSTKELKAEELIKRLGGTIKIGKVLREFGYEPFISPEALSLLILENLKPTKKLFFGFSLEKNEGGVLNSALGLKNIKKLGIEVKRLLKKKGINSRFVTSREKTLSSVVVKKNRLVSEQGIELVFIVGSDKIWLGKTFEVQNFEDYSFFDYMRPARDSHVGMLPPKLAKMMINIAGLSFDKKILDPFCGSGTIMQEALLMGYKDVIGGDISQKMVENTLTNLDWLKVKRNLPKLDEDYKLYRGDASKLSEIVPRGSLDGIVTEPHLGPPLTGRESAKKLAAIISELSSLYIGAFGEFKKVLSSSGVVVMIWPIFAFDHSNLSIDILSQVEEIGFESVLKKESPKLVKTTSRGSIIYSRPDQWVQREIFKFRLRKLVNK